MTVAINPPAEGRRVTAHRSIGENDAVSVPREIVLLGSTGSIGTQAIDIVRRNPDLFRVVALGAGGGNVELLAAQALEFDVEIVGVAKASMVQDLQLAFYAVAQQRGYATGGFRLPKIVAGPDAMTELAAWPCDVVLNGVVGSLGLAPTLAALRAGRVLALANKESLVAGGPLVRAIAKPGQIVPVDSEHSALAQCLRAGTAAEVRRLVLTASGGAFRGRSRADLEHVTPDDALEHPTWDMGPVVTINTATMVNKGLEVIEAHELFSVPYSDISVMVHPQSVVHSMVEFRDGSTIAQCSPPDMRLPIALALGWPARVDDAATGVDWTPGAHLGVRAARRRSLPRRAPREGGRRGGSLPSGDLQRGKRGVRGGLRRRAAPVPRHRRFARTSLGGGAEFRRTRYRRGSSRGRILGACSCPHSCGGRDGRVVMQALGIVLFALIIMISVCLHEAGHMVTAKAFGMKVTRYFAGFGPTLWSFKRGETEYGLKAIPLGGFVKIVGMTPQDDDVEPGDEKRAMWRFPVWKRTIVMSAGSITHFIIAFVLLWIAFAFIGMPNPALTKIVNDPNTAPTYIAVQQCAEQAPDRVTCVASDPKSPALVGGLKDGDKIVAVNSVRVANYGQLVKQIRSIPPNVPTTISYVRDGQPADATVSLASVMRAPLDNPTGKPVAASALGISSTFPPGVPIKVTYGPVRGIGQAGSYFGNMFGEIGTALKSLPAKVPNLWSALSGNPRDPNGPISVVGASEIGGQTVKLGLWNYFFVLAASLNLFIGVFNLLPLLPLDGGHIAIAWFERVRSWLARRRNRPDPGRVNYFKLMPITYVVIVIFGGFSLLTILADIVNPINIAK